MCRFAFLPLLCFFRFRRRSAEELSLSLSLLPRLRFLLFFFSCVGGERELDAASQCRTAERKHSVFSRACLLCFLCFFRFSLRSFFLDRFSSSLSLDSVLPLRAG